jgi:hypothetical protein
MPLYPAFRAAGILSNLDDFRLNSTIASGECAIKSLGVALVFLVSQALSG